MARPIQRTVQNVSNRVPTTIVKNANGTTAAIIPSQQVPLRKQVFHDGAFKSLDDVARQLNTMQTEFHDSTLPARTNPRNQSLTFENLVFNGTDAYQPITHNLGTKVRWSVVRWYSTSSAPGLFEVSQNDSVIQWNSTTAGTADVEVWSA